jgi:hypothetical protein
MLRTVSKKVGQIDINTVGLPGFLRPARAMRNNPPQRGGLRHVNKFALKGQWIKIAPLFCIALSGRLFERDLPTALRWVVMQCP